MYVGFRVDATGRIGGGHVMRCLTLADELRERGAQTKFVAAAITPALADRIRGAGHELERIPAPEELEQRSGENWHEPVLPAPAQVSDAQAAGSVLERPADWLVVDHYMLDENWHSTARKTARRLLAIDDLANRRFDCDLILDQTLGRNPADYADLAPETATILAGSVYALLRPEFAQERPAALERRREPAPPRRILLSLGSTDIGGITAPVLEKVIAAAPHCAIDVVLGRDAQSLARVQELAKASPGVSVHLDTRHMAMLMRNADLAVGAAGSTSWERCCLGLPSLSLVLAGNQEGIARALAQTGASLTVDLQSIGRAVAELIADPMRLSRMSAAAFEFVDGLGTRRVADLLFELASRSCDDTPRAEGMGGR